MTGVFVALLVSMASWLSASPAMACRGEPKQSKCPHDCKKGDRACVMASWVEYEAGMRAEMGFWAKGVEIVLAGRRDRAHQFIHTAGNWYRHRSWTMPYDKTFVDAGVDWEDMESIDGCRTAILLVKYAIADLQFAKSGEEMKPAVELRSHINEPLSLCAARAKAR